MKKQKIIESPSKNLHRRGKKLIKNKPQETGSFQFESEISDSGEQLKVNKIELELNNEEIRLAKEESGITSQKYSELYNFASLGYFILSREGKIIELNLNGAQILRKERSNLLGSSFDFFVSDDSKPVFNYFLITVFENKTKATCELKLQFADNTIKHIYLTGTFSATENHCVAIATDITERTQIEKALLDSELKFQKYIDFAPHGVFVANEIGEYIEVNSSAGKITGYSKDELLSMKITDLVPPESVADAVSHFTRVAKDGFASGVLPLIKKDKSKGYWSVDAVKLSDKLFLGFVIDYTERRKAEEALLESEQRYRLLFEESNNAIFLADMATGYYTDCNRMAETLTGYSREELIHMKKGSLLSPQRKGELASNMEILRSGKTLQRETEIATKDGNLIPVEFNASIVTINKKEFILSLLHDISKRKNAEDALKQSEERVRIKLQSILSPEGSIANLELKDIIDAPSIQQLMDNFYQLVQIPMAIIDLQGKVLVGVGWQDICSKFHRVHPLACRNCFESDVHLTRGIPDGEFMLYKCKNNMWDMATPIIIGGEHKGNLYMGQFFFDDQPIEEELFREQANKFGFEEQEYLDALSRVPRLSKKKLDSAKEFFLNLARTISQLSYSNIKLARAIEQQKNDELALRESESKFKSLIQNLHVGVLLHGPQAEILLSNPKAHELLGIYEEMLAGAKSFDPDWQVINENGFSIPQSELPVFRVFTTLKPVHDAVIGLKHPIKSNIVWLLVQALPQLSAEGNVQQVITTFIDITKLKQAENAIKKLNEELEDRVRERTADLLKSYDNIKLAEEKYRTIADYNYDWETWLSPEGKYIYVSPSCYRISGYSVDDFMNDPTLYYKIAHPGDQERVESHYYDSLKSDNSDSSLDFRIITRNGEEKWISHSCQSVYNKEGQWLGQRGSNSDITERKKVESFLVNSQDDLRSLTQHMNEITENERKNIAREIHDELGHMLTALKYDIDNLMNNSELTAEAVNSELPVMLGMVESLIDSVKKIATELRPGILDHLGLFPAMEWQINQFRITTKINCKYIADESLNVTFNKSETTNIFRILQEILTNVARHSKAKEVIISVQKKNDVFIMKVDDNGIGFKMNDNVQSSSLGLLGMKERALAIGGEIQIASEQGRGTSVTFLLYKK